MMLSRLSSAFFHLGQLCALAQAVLVVPQGPTEGKDALVRRASATISAAGSVVTVASSGTYLRVNSVTFSDGSSGLLGGYTDTTDSGSDKILRVVQSNNTGESWDLVGSVAQAAIATSEIDNRE